MAARPQNDGYWMVAADGGIFSFGRAPFLGSGASPPRSSPCVGDRARRPPVAATRCCSPTDRCLPYGDVPNLGGANGRIFGSAVGLAGNFKPLG